MKALATQICELQQTLIDKKLCVEADLKQLHAATEEETLSRVKAYAKEKGITESGRPTRVKRNNGAFFEGSVEDRDQNRVETCMRTHKMTIREASIFVGLSDPGPSAKPSANFNEALRDRWKKYAPWINEADLNQLVARGIEP
jgi:hypothetical protein